MKRTLKGKVVSAKAEKTISVLIERSKIHPIYRKKFAVSKKFLVHDELGVKEGDYVMIEETSPVSKNKKWKVVKKIKGEEVK